MLGTTIWYDILFVVNFVSKSLQNVDVQIDVAIDQLKGLISFFENHRDNRFTSSIISSKEIANNMEIELKFHEKRVIHRKRQFDENLDDERIIQFAEESFRINYFVYIIDQAISSLKSRLKQFKVYRKYFWIFI